MKTALKVALGALLTTVFGGQALACYTVYNRANQVIYRAMQAPVDMQYRAGQRMGLAGTPMIIDANGEMLGGYLPPDALLQRLEAKPTPTAGV